MDNINKDNLAYWQQRARGYSAVNLEELEGVQNEKWTSFLTEQILSHFGKKSPRDITILDIGAGPGFISIILAKAGFSVTAFDFSDEMLIQAKENAKAFDANIRFIQGDAMELPFDKSSFDVVFSRNLTWNIPFPEEAYESWIDVLKPNGLMMVFDANWYSYLKDEVKRKEYEIDRLNVASEGMEDYNIGDNFDEMEQIADRMPFTGVERPRWDEEFLSSLNKGEVQTFENIGEKLYSKKEIINYKSTPLFMVRFIKD